MLTPAQRQTLEKLIRLGLLRHALREGRITPGQFAALTRHGR